MELTIGALVEAIAQRPTGGQAVPGSSIAARERLDGLLIDLAHLLDEIEDDASIPMSQELRERITLAMGVWPALRRHRYVAHRLGIELRPLGAR